LLPGIKIEEFQARRENFMNLITKDVIKTYGKPMHIVAIIPSATKTYMTEKIPYVFRQNTDFLYLSGCLEPDTALVLNGISAKDFTSTILLRPFDAQAILWDGPRTSKIFHFTISISISNNEFGFHSVLIHWYRS